MDQNRMNFEQLLNETRKVDLSKEDKKVNESDALGKGPDKGPKMNGKDPDLSNVNEDVSEEEDVSGVDDSEPMAAAETEEEVVAEEEGKDKDSIEDLISYNLLDALKKLSLEIKQELAESGVFPDEIVNYLATILKDEKTEPAKDEESGNQDIEDVEPEIEVGRDKEEE